MRYMLMMHAPRGAGDYAINGWSREALEAHMEFMFALNRELAERGELADAQGLDVPANARIVRVSQNGTPLVTDGPWTETKEFLAGFWVVDVATPERAYEIAARASGAPGPDGAPLRMAIEVRQVMEGPLKEDLPAAEAATTA